MLRALTKSSRQDRTPHVHKRTRVMHEVTLVTLASYARRFPRKHGKLVSRENKYAVKYFRLHSRKNPVGLLESMINTNSIGTRTLSVGTCTLSVCNV